MRVTPWRQESIQDRWAEISPLIRKSLGHAHGEMSLADLYQYMIDGTYITLVADEGGELAAVFCLRVVKKPRMRILLIEQAGGERMAEWLPAMWNYCHDLKRKIQCDRLELVGRPGWARALRKHFPGHIREKAVSVIIEE